jgi:hypothetical protein
MRSCRARAFVPVALALALAAAGPALAETGKPLPLGGADDLDLGTVNVRAVPGPAPQPLTVVPDRPRPRPGKVDASELKAPDPGAVGVLDDKQGLGVDMWDGTPAVTVRRFLPLLPVTTPSRTMRQLARRLLLTAATPPGNDHGVPAANDHGVPPSLLQLRAERLFAMGETESLAALLKAAPVALGSPGLSRVKVDTLLLTGQSAAACAELPAARAGGSDPQLAKLQVFCDFTAGRTLEGNLGLELLRERKDSDHAFIAAAEVLGGLPPAPADKMALPNPTPLHLAAFQAAKLPLPADAANAAQPAVLKAIAAANGAAEPRLLAAERAEAMGVLDSESLRQLYTTITFTPAEAQAPPNDKSARGRALLFRSALHEALPGVRAEIVARALKAAGDHGAFAAAARLYAPLIAAVMPAPDLAGFAPLAARALYAAGKPDAAAHWLDIAKANPDTAKAAADLWPLARLYDPVEDRQTPPAVIAGWRAARELPAGQAERRAAVAFALVSAVGENIPASEWLSLLDGPLSAVAPSPRPALKAMLRSAVEGLHLGETVLLTLVALGDTGLDRVDPDTLNRAIAALRQVGLEREARELAVEAALVNGV